MGHSERTAGVYLHIPFCRRKCPYCDFVSFAGCDELHGAYVEALLMELAERRSDWNRAFDTLFLGGGTPTVFSARQLARLIAHCRETLSLPADAETTVEANPGTVDAKGLAFLASAGVTRISLGVQSLHDEELRLLGRIHDREQALAAYGMARDAGLSDVNLDLIFGLPGQSLESWRANLAQALALAPEHLALYALTLSPETPMAKDVARGRLPRPDDDLAAEMYELAEEMLERGGYEHYEISNWARRDPDADSEGWPRYVCRHNLHYWRNEPYLGLGAAAHSYDGQVRCANLSDPRAYIEGVNEGKSLISFRERLSRERRMDETLMLGLRLMRGVSREAFHERFGVPLRTIYAEQIDDMAEKGLLVVDEQGIRLSRRGHLLGDRVFAAFLR